MLWWTLRQLRSENTGIRRKAARRLSECPDQRAVEPLITALHDQDIDVADFSAKALGRIGNAPAVSALINSLQLKTLRRHAIVGLCETRDLLAIDPLIEALEWGDAALRNDVILALVKTGTDSAFVAVWKALTHSVPEIIFKDLAQSMKEAEKAHLRTLLFKQMERGGLKHRKSVLRQIRSMDWRPQDNNEKALIALADGQYEKAFGLGVDLTDSMIEILERSSVFELKPLVQAMRGLSDRGVGFDRGIVGPLVKILIDRHSGHIGFDLHEAIIRLLANIGDPQSMRGIFVSLIDHQNFPDGYRGPGDHYYDNEHLLRVALEAAREIGFSAAEFLLQESTNPMSSRLSAQFLGEVGDETAIGRLIELTRDRSCADVAIPALAKVLERSASNVCLEELSRLASLEDATSSFDETRDAEGDYYITHTSCVTSSEVRRLAREELALRGVDRAIEDAEPAEPGTSLP